MTISANGQFPLKMAAILNRDVGPSLLSTKFVWHCLILKNISIFLWRLFLNRLPINEAVLKKGFSIASRCSCCPLNPASETFSYVFITSDIAFRV